MAGQFDQSRLITVSAAEDNGDTDNGNATIRHHTDGPDAYAGVYTYFPVSEIDNDTGGGNVGVPPEQLPSAAVQPSPPGGVGSVTASRAEGAIVAVWSAADRAEGYHVVYSADGSRSWTRAATNHAGLSYTIPNAADALNYVVGVQAANSAGVSAWVNSNAVPAIQQPAPPPPPSDGADPSLSVNAYGLAQWSYAIPGDAEFAYAEIRWRETAGQSGPNDWSGKSNRVYYNPAISAHQIADLTPGAQYKAKLFIRLRVDGKDRYLKSNTATFTPQEEGASIN